MIADRIKRLKLAISPALDRRKVEAELDALAAEIEEARDRYIAQLESSCGCTSPDSCPPPSIPTT